MPVIFQTDKPKGYSTSPKDPFNFQEVFDAMTIWERGKDPMVPMVTTEEGVVLKDKKEIEAHIERGNRVFIIEPDGSGKLDSRRVTMFSKSEGASDSLNISTSSISKGLLSDRKEEKKPSVFKRLVHGLVKSAFTDVSEYKERVAVKEERKSVHRDFVNIFENQIKIAKGEHRTPTIGTNLQSDQRVRFEAKRDAVLKEREAAGKGLTEEQKREFIASKRAPLRQAGIRKPVSQPAAIDKTGEVAASNESPSIERKEAGPWFEPIFTPPPEEKRGASNESPSTEQKEAEPWFKPIFTPPPTDSKEKTTSEVTKDILTAVSKEREKTNPDTEAAVIDVPDIKGPKL